MDASPEEGNYLFERVLPLNNFTTFANVGIRIVFPIQMHKINCNRENV